MVFSIKSKKEKQQKQVNVEEVFVLWDTLLTDYKAIDRMLIWENYTHDKDLLMVLHYIIGEFKETARDLEKIMKSLAISPTETPRQGTKTSTNSEIINDADIGGFMLQLLQEKIELHLRAIRASTTNDDVRKFFSRLLRKRTDHLDRVIKYLRLKGWINQPPFYLNVPTTFDEKIDTAEIYHLWDHLNFRYANIEQTQLFYTFVHDGDLKIILEIGEKKLREQASIIEKELMQFGVPMSVKPRKFEITHNTQILKDEYIFKTIFNGMQNAAIIHAQALKESTTNDRIRKLFKKLLLEEVDLSNNYYKYGKLKGWINIPPEFRL